MGENDRIKWQFLPGEEKEDLEQERKLAEIEGRKGPSLAHAHLSRKDMGYGLSAPEDALPLWVPEIPSEQTISTLMSWTYHQSERVKKEVLSYLDNPTEGQLSHIIQLINGHISQRPKELTLTDLILLALPATKDQLYDLARNEHQAKRPEAAVRQTLRNLMKRGAIVQKGDLYAATEGVGSLSVGPRGLKESKEADNRDGYLGDRIHRSGEGSSRGEESQETRRLYA